MTIYYRDEIGIIGETLSDSERGNSIDFADGYAYFTFADREDGEPEDRKIPIASIISIGR